MLEPQLTNELKAGELPSAQVLPNPMLADSACQKPNPYKLVYWRSDWSERKTKNNNMKYWQFEIQHNGLRVP
jgi:hypothetical protein